MDMTGDPNQRNRPSMFGFESSYPNPTLNLPRFNEEAASAGATMSSLNTAQDSSQCLFATNSSSPFSVNNSLNPIANVPYNSSYIFPSTSSLNMPSPPVNRFAFPFTQTPAPAPGCSNFPESSFPSTSHSTHPFVSSKLNWTHPVKPTFTFPSRSTNLAGIIAKPFAGTFGCKRKTESPPLPPLKQHITEERMAEHMSRLHISSQTPASPKESQPARERRLYMCEEMQRLQAESIIPVQILERVSRPCTALVPWRPPMVPPLRKENNNNEEEPDNNLMEESDSNSADMES